MGRAYRLLIVWSGVLGILVAPPPTVSACSCFGRAYADHARGAAAIFEGRVVDYERRVQPQDPGGWTDRVRFQVGRVWKGPLTPDAPVELRTGGWCDSFFQPRAEYLVWAQRLPDGSLGARLDCSPTRDGPVLPSDPALEFLSRPVPPRLLVGLLGAVVLGTLSLIAWQAVGQTGPPVLRSTGALVALGLALSGALYGLWAYDQDYGWREPLSSTEFGSWWVSVATPLLILPGVGLLLALIASLRTRWWLGLVLLPPAYYSGFLLHALLIHFGF
jgi:hypothetical protein